MKPKSPRTFTLLGCCGALLLCLQLASAATLTNRYSFTSDATDSVGGRHGELLGGAYIFAGSAALDGLSAYVNLPNDLVATRESVTFEIWVKPYSNPDWARIWDFGNSNAGEDNSDYGVKHFMCAVRPSLRATIYAGGVDTWIYSTPAVLLTEFEEAHVVWTSDSARGVAMMYVNGELVGQNLDAVNTLATLGPTFNNWLGRSQYSADAYLYGEINEFRIWDGALSALEVAASAQSGPDTIGTNAGTVTGIVLEIDANMQVDTMQQAVVMATTSQLTQPVNVASIDGITYESSNTSVLTVDAFGAIQAVGAGSATVTVSYAGQSDNQAVTVTARPAELTHRYSFTTDASDSQGTAHGTLQGGATISGGEVILDAATDSHVQLPAGVLGGAQALTVETWASFGEVATWSRLWHLGDQTPSGGARYYIECCPRGSAEDVFIGCSDSDPGGAHAQAVARGGALMNMNDVHVVAVFNTPGGYHALYIDGALVGSNLGASVDLTKVQDLLNYIGRSLYVADPYMAGSVDEFRIYDGALSSIQVASSHAAGPDTVGTDPGELQSITLQLDATMPVESAQTPAVVANYANLANYDLTGNAVRGVPGLTVTSSAPSVIAIDPDLTLRSLAAGTSTITASYQGKTSAVTVTVTLPKATLLHRYSFKGNANDLVGTAHGTLQGSATVSAGKLVLNGSSGTYLNLPGGLVTGLSGVTIEFWADFGAQPNWCRVFDFGNTTPGGAGQNFLFFTPKAGFGGQRLGLATSAGARDLDIPGVLENSSEHIVCISDPSSQFHGVYRNGVLVDALYNNTIPLSTVATNFCYVGRSLFTADGYLNASIDEFRIYEGRLSSEDVALTHELGPETLLTERVELSVRLDGSQAVLSWPKTATGYGLVSSPALGAGADWKPAGGTPVEVGDNLEVRIPATAEEAYYLLKK